MHGRFGARFPAAELKNKPFFTRYGIISTATKFHRLSAGAVLFNWMVVPADGTAVFLLWTQKVLEFAAAIHWCTIT